ncbi:uncharacterized protein LOC123291589 [Chrysoperla carnea]|uniref:uncharacterized protein LOC123291589 n=1 Tax=Chrysoperla carnea TaxID=189513 RepID=UPI001D067C56|nr:uncharacterized protein LOC123291589 [Chrysoperla carnea]
MLNNTHLHKIEEEYERLNVLYERNWTRLVHEQLRKFESSIVAATKVEGFNTHDLLEQERHWSFTGSLLYSVTIITTIGYGNLAPKTPEGKIVTMLYALIGVPLMLVCLSSLGALLADTFQFIYSFLCCVPCTTATKAKSSKKNLAATSHNQNKSKRHKENEKGYVHTYQKAPIISSTSPSPRHFNHHTLRRSRETVIGIGGSGHYHEELREISTFPRRTMLATVNTAACGRPKLQSRALSTELHQMTTNIGGSTTNTGEAHHLLAECTDCSSTPVHLASATSTLRRSNIPPTPPPPRPPPTVAHHMLVASGGTLSTTETDDGEDLDENQSSLCAHDTPSRMPLIWRKNHSHHHQNDNNGESSSKSRKSSTTQNKKNNNHISKKHKNRSKNSSITKSITNNPKRTLHNIPIVLVLLILIAYICVGAYFFGEINTQWTYLDGVYFCFTTLSTIGFGDFVPGILNKQLSTTTNNNGQYIILIACCTYLLIGLVLIAMSFSLIQDEIILKCRRTAIAFGFLNENNHHHHHSSSASNHQKHHHRNYYDEHYQQRQHH